MNNKVLSVCFIFCFSGFCNYGSTRYFFAIPFMLVAVIIMFRKTVKLGLITLGLIGCGIIFNATLTSNPIFFPILMGSVEVNKSGYMMIYGETSEYISLEDFELYYKDDSIAKFEVVKNDTKLAIIKIESENLDPGKMGIHTDQGIFRKKDFDRGVLKSRFPLEMMITPYLGGLMYYPLLGAMIFYKIMP